MTATFNAIRIPFFAVVFIALAALLAPHQASASQSASIGPGKTKVLRGNSNGGLTRLCITTSGSDPVQVEIKSKTFNQIITVKPGKCQKLNKNLGKEKVYITNKSTSATIRVESKWL